jgi:hypothetical protein
MLTPKRATPKRATEKQIENIATQLLCACGCEVVTVGGSRPQGQRGYVGNTVGIPDKLVRHSTWPRGMWVGLEFKRGESEVNSMLRRSDPRGVAQTAIWMRGGSWVIWTPQQALEAILVANTALSMPGHERVNERIRTLINGAMGRWDMDTKPSPRSGH